MIFNKVTSIKFAPKLVSSTPEVNSSAINPHQNIVLTFDEPVKASSGYITITSGKDIHKIALTDKQVTISGKTVTINPTDDLLFNSHYTVSIDSAAIDDLAGNKFGGEIFTFDTTDTIAPVLRTTSPSNDNKLVAVNRNIDFNFNEKIKLGSGNIVLTHGTDVIKIPVNNPQVTISNAKLTLNPTTDFALGSVYTVSLDAGAVNDLAGNAFAGDGAGFTFYTKPAPVTHTPVPVVTPPVPQPVVLTPPVVTPPVTMPVVITPSAPLIPNDTIAPTLLSFAPQVNSVNVAPSSNIVLTFDENVQAGTGNFFISDSTGVRTIPVTDSQVTISGNTVTINPTLDLNSATNYRITLSNGVVKDMTGNAFAGLNDLNILSFTTSNSVTSGKAIDGYLKGATVFADANGNGVWDPGEAKTTTDDNGDFKLTNARGAIVATGGIDLTSNLPFIGTLKAPAGSKVVTPLTTVQQGFVESGLSVQAAQTATAKAFGFDAAVDLKTYDPIAALKSANPTNQQAATDLMASATKIANFLATGSQVLNGAANKDATTGQENLSLQNANNALLKSLVSNIKSAADGTVNLADTTVLRSVLIDSSKQSETDTKNFTAAESTDYEIRIAKMADSVTEILKNSANSIIDTVSQGGDATALLANMGKVASFTQNDAGGILHDTARTFDTQSTTVATDLITLATTLNTLQNSTGDFATKSAALTNELNTWMNHPTDVVAPTLPPTPPTNNDSSDPVVASSINLNQGNVSIAAIPFDATGGDKKYVIDTVIDSVLKPANVTLTGFGTGDTLTFQVDTPTDGFTAVDALYGISDNGTDIKIAADEAGSVQFITLVGMTGDRSNVGGQIDTVTELSTFLGGSSILFV